MARAAFLYLDENVRFDPLVQDGDEVAGGSVIATIEGLAVQALAAERTALNFMQRMSGIATLTRRYVAEVEGTDAQVIDTRKTLPGWRVLDKYAVRAGGGGNHRIGLYDEVLLKEPATLVKAMNQLFPESWRGPVLCAHGLSGFPF